MSKEKTFVFFSKCPSHLTLFVSMFPQESTHHQSFLWPGQGFGYARHFSQTEGHGVGEEECVSVCLPAKLWASC